MIPPIHRIYSLPNLSSLKLRLRINDFGLFACIGATVSSRDYFIILTVYIYDKIDTVSMQEETKFSLLLFSIT